jgi:predicted AlkP superfamily phosphohydrolase/phosphomutase
MRRQAVRYSLFLTGLLVLISLTSSCGRRVERPTKVIVVGVDAADWGVMRPLLDEGKLPNFTRLMKEGSTGRSETFIPLTKSPILWTSIATSKLPDEHGIGGFVQSTKTGRAVPYTGNVRKVKAIWDILGEHGMKVAVVGWLVTWPAQKVNGYLVSDYIQYEAESGIKIEHQTYPESLFYEIDSLRLRKPDLTDAMIAPIYPVDRTAEEMGVEPWRKDYAKMIYATDETFRRIALKLGDKDVDFLAVYFNGIDSMCHNLWDQSKNRNHPLCHVIDNYYVWMDQVLGQFMDLMDDRTLLVVCSDHGFYGPRRAPDGGLMLGVQMHGRYGIVGFMGRGIRPGSQIPNAGILDITPTILYALGLPVARDMHGKVLTDAFESDFLRNNPVKFVPTYETGERKAGEPIASPVDDQIKDRLKAVGYIQ